MTLTIDSGVGIALGAEHSATAKELLQLADLAMYGVRGPDEAVHSAVVEMALAQCRTWADDGVRLTVSVNVSPSDLVDDDFPDEVVALLRRFRLPASRWCSR